MNQCPNCQQPILPDDTTCWHCGTKLEPQPEPAAPLRDLWRTNELDPLGSGGYSGTTIMYSVMTLSVILGMLVSLQLLGQYPLVQTTFGERIPLGYRVATAGNRQFTTYIPLRWLAVDPFTATGRAELSELLMANETLLEEVLRPLSDRATDFEIIYLATDQPAFDYSDGSLAFLVVVRSRQLANILLEDTPDLVTTHPGIIILQDEVVENADKSHLTISMRNQPIGADAPLPASGYVVECLQQLVPDENEALLAVVCTDYRPGEAFTTNRELRETVLAGFQYLRPSRR